MVVVVASATDSKKKKDGSLSSGSLSPTDRQTPRFAEGDNQSVKGGGSGSGGGGGGVENTGNDDASVSLLSLPSPKSLRAPESSKSPSSSSSPESSEPSPPLDQDGKPTVAIAESQQQKGMGSRLANSMTSSSFKLLLLILMVLQNSSVVLIGRHTRTGVRKEELYVVNHLIVLIEVGKLVFAATFEYFHTSGKLWKSVKDNIIDRPIDAIKIIIPSLLYLVQNSLLYVGLSNLSTPIFQVTYQCKLLTTALVSVIMLNRRYSLKQWICLAFLGIGVAIVVLGEAEDKQREEEAAAAASGGSGNGNSGDESSSSAAGEKNSRKPEQNLFVGLVAVTVACMCSALAGVYFEKVLKKPTVEAGAARAPVSMWMRNVQMAFFSVCIGLVQYVNLKGADKEKPWLYGFTGWVYLLILLQAGGGMLVAAVIKYADNVLKGLATGVSVVFASLCSMVLFGTRLSLQFTFGAAIILGSVFFFSNDVPGKKVDKDNSSNLIEMKKLLPK